MLKTLLFVPNIIGYVRFILLAFFILYDIREEYYVAIACYFISIFLDEFDGRIARYLNQCSSFGSQLDYAIDYLSVYVIFMACYGFIDDDRVFIKLFIMFFIATDTIANHFWVSIVCRTNVLTHTGPGDGIFMFRLLQKYYSNKNFFRILVLHDHMIFPICIYAFVKLENISIHVVYVVITMCAVRRVIQIQKFTQATVELLNTKVV